MTLEQFLKSKNLTGRDFAESIGRDPSTISKIIRGRVKPDSKTLESIIAATDGQVTPNDFFDLPSQDAAE